MTFRNVDEFQKRLVKSSLVWSRTLSTVLSYLRMEKTSASLCSRKWPLFRIFTVSNWTTGHLN